MKNKLLVTAILVSGLIFVSFETNQLFGQTTKSNMAMKDTTIKYTCPHHPDVVSDKPGKCACGMELVAMKDKDKMSKKTKMKKEGMMDDSKDMKHDKMKKDSAMMKKGKM